MSRINKIIRFNKLLLQLIVHYGVMPLKKCGKGHLYYFIKHWVGLIMVLL